MGSSSGLYSVLEIPGFTRQVRLGCMADERSVPQGVDFQIKIGFHETLVAEGSDELEDTVCYAQLSEKVSHLVEANEYKLIEKLARDVFMEVQSMLPQNATLQVRVHKLKPPIDILTQGVYYTMGDMSL
ncbi:MAG: dihydroneopterin aldolase [Bdellovibrionales bacterium]|nr:dihydroneopterin aldolase [Bdellovibrionales bacterium]NQZ18927.1 dihydroneopterin aldolase [Bdellovibrionales bacterium]